MLRGFVVSSVHDCVQSVRKNIREDMEDKWVKNLSEDRKRFYLVSSLLDPHTKMLSICDNKYFSSSWKTMHRSDLDELLGIRTTSMDFDVSALEGQTQLQV
jgi:hypothetical protein